MASPIYTLLVGAVLGTAPASAQEPGLVPAGAQLGVVAVRGQSWSAAAAEALRSRLVNDPRLAVATPTTWVTPAADPSQEDALQQAAERVRAAEAHYRGLEPQQAIDSLRAAVATLEKWLDEPETASLLARALRVRGLTELYLEKEQAASRSFATAAFLDGDFVPIAEQWPPPARLAHADALATSRRLNPGSLSLRVKPEAAAVWLDGRYVGTGSRTLQEVGAGEHHLLATCPGHERLAVVVAVEGDGRLADAAIFLQPLQSPEVSPVSRALQRLTAHLLSPTSGTPERIAIRQAASLLGVQALVVVAGSGGEEATEGAAMAPSAWVLHGEQGPIGAPVALDNLDFAADEIAARLVGRSPVELVVVGGSRPWYASKALWAVAGGVVLVTASTLTYVALRRGSSDRITLALGR